MTLYLFRHAKAGERERWEGDDFLRPLSNRGRRQAEGLVDLYTGVHLDRVLSSPYVRCMESVVPLAGRRCLPIEPVEALAEGATLDAALSLVRKHAHHETLMCTHGDVIPMLLEHYSRNGLALAPAPQWPKGSTWVLELDGNGEASAARYLPPPPDRPTEPPAR